MIIFHLGREGSGISTELQNSPSYRHVTCLPGAVNTSAYLIIVSLVLLDKHAFVGELYYNYQLSGHHLWNYVTTPPPPNKKMP